MPVPSNDTDTVTQSDLDRLIRYNEELNRSRDSLDDLIPALRQATRGIESYNGDCKTLQQTLRTFDSLQQTVSQRLRTFAALRPQLEQLTQHLADGYVRAARESTTQANALSRQQDTLLASSKAARTTARDIESLRDKLTDTTSTASEMATGIRSAKTELGSLGSSASVQSAGFTPLREQIGRIAGELPSLRGGVSQFISAVTSHIPELTSRLLEAAQANKALREANKGLAADQQTQIVPVWKQLLSAVTSWQTALVTGVSLVATYHKEIGQFFSQLFNGPQAVSDTAKALEAMNKAMNAEYVGTKVADFKRLATLYKELGDNAQAKEGFIRKYRDEINGLGIAVNNVADADNLFINGEDAFIGSIKQRAKALGGFKLAAEKYGEASALEVKYASKIAELEAERAEYEAMAPGTKKAITSGFEVINISREELILSVNAAIQKYRNEILQLEQEAGALIEVSNQANQDADTTLQKNGLNKLDPKTQSQDNSTSSPSSRLAEKRQAEIELEKTQANEAATIQRSIYEDESNSYTLRLAALAKFYVQKQALAEASFQADKEELDDRLAAAEISQDTYDAVLRNLSVTHAIALQQLHQQEQTEAHALSTAQAEEEAATQQAIYENEQEIYWKRLDALDKFVTSKQAIIDADYQAGLNRLNDLQQRGAIDAQAYEAEKNALENRHAAQTNALQQNAGKTGSAIFHSTLGLSSETLSENLTRQMAEAQNAEQLALAKQYGQGLISKEKYEQEKAAITDKYTRQVFDQEINLLKGQLKYFSHSTEDRQKLAKELADKEVQYNQYKNQQEIANETQTAEKRNELRQKQIELFTQLGTEVLSLASTQNDAWLEEETDRLDKDTEANEAWRDNEIARIERMEEQGVISKEQAEARKQQIENQTAANEEEIEKKRIEAQRKAAIYNKMISATQIAINTAMGIVKTIGEVGMPAAIPLIAITAAIGAAQLAKVIAEPIPEYARGTTDHGGGLAIVGDGGRPELVLLPDHTMWRTPATDTLVNLPEHAQVLPDYYAAVRELAVPRLEGTDVRLIDMSGVMRRLEQTGDKITETNRLFRVSIARADKRAKINRAMRLNDNNSKLWN